MDGLERLTAEVCRVARLTGQYLRAERLRFDPGRIEEKHAHDFVSYVDREAERIAVDGLLPLFPGAGFLTEEGTAGYAGEQACWVVDPLDGTTNFIHDLPPFAVSVALCEGGSVRLGVVYEVCRDECFAAWQGGGAWLGGKRLRVADGLPLGRMLVGMEMPYVGTDCVPAARRVIDRFYGSAAGLRMNGSAATSLAYVAAGRLGAWAERGIRPWDFDAGMLLVTEAGGVVSDFAGAPARTDGDQIVAAATPGLLGTMLEVLDDTGGGNAPVGT